jgi:Domain of unknown function (DUF4124)
MNARILALAVVVWLAPLAAEAQSYRCVGADGKRYYGSSVPSQCYGLPVEQLNKNGLVVKRIDPQAAEKERRAKAEAEGKKREQEAASREVTRRNTALLATYTSEKDIDNARARALAENTKAVRDVEVRIEGIRKRQGGYEKELEQHKSRGGEAPAKLRDDMMSADNELTANIHLLETKKREAEAINARYDEDKKRYVQITGKR